MLFNPTALRKAKIVYNFGLSEYKGVKRECFSAAITKGDNVTMFASLGLQTPSKMESTFIEKNLSLGQQIL